jgi:AcrR family transcriptional regulator
MTDAVQTTTRDRILDAAESLFANHGFEGASIRAIVDAAKVNLAAIHYHFHSKEALLEAVLTRRIVLVNGARLKRLEEAEAAAAPQPASVDKILRAFIVPTIEFAHRDRAGATFVQLMSRMFTEPRFSLTNFMGRKFGDTIARFSNALVRALPHLPRKVVLWRAFFTMGAMHHLLCSPDKVDLLSEGLRASTSDEDLTEYLVGFAVAGICATNRANGTRKRKSKTAHSRKHK